MAKGRATDLDIIRAIEELALLGYNKAETHRRILARFPADAPTDRTVAKYFDRVTPSDLSEPWRLDEMSGGEIRLVLPVLATVLELTEGRTRHLTGAEARWIVRLREAAPDLPLWDAYRVARWYIARAADKSLTQDMDLLLAFAPWRESSRFENALERGWIDSFVTWDPRLLEARRDAMIRGTRSRSRSDD
jgi:hypothetical protein